MAMVVLLIDIAVNLKYNFIHLQAFLNLTVWNKRIGGKIAYLYFFSNLERAGSMFDIFAYLDS